jgi:AAA domain/TrwC relaxase
MGAVVTAKSGYDLGYAWKGQTGAEPEKSPGGYYMNAAQAGEAPGRWFGPGAEALGLAEGQALSTEEDKVAYYAVYQQIHPVTGEKLGRAPKNGSKTELDADVYLAALLDAEPHATRERQRELAREAARMTRSTAPYTDVTVSWSKSVSILHASIRENARQARMAGDDSAAAWWDAREARFQQILQAANLAALRHAQEWAGMTRTGYHGGKVDGRETGRWAAAGVVVASWLQGTSRDGDPHDHEHNQFARMVQTVGDGKWRALDTMALRNQLPAMQAIAAAHGEPGLAREFGVAWVARADGAGNEIRGISQAQMDSYSSRAKAIEEGTPEAVRLWTAKHGRAPNQRELLYIQNEVWERTRDGKPEGAIDWDALGAKWDATAGGKLAQVARGVSRSLRGPGSPAPENQPAQLKEAALAATVSKALARVQAAHATWTRADLMKHIGLAMPVSSRALEPDESVALLHRLTDRALAGEFEAVVPLEAPEWPAQPEYLRRELDGRSVYTRPGSERFATRLQLTLEERLVAAAQRQGAPCLAREDAARLLGADADTLDATLQEKAQDARARGATSTGLRLDQGAAAYHLLTSPRTVEVMVGPAGSGKTRTLAQVVTALTEMGCPVIGTATSQGGTNALLDAGVPEAVNTSVFLGHACEKRGARGPLDLEPGTWIICDEASMTSTMDLHDLAVLAARGGHKLIISGDHAQLTAVESGGGMNLLVSRIGSVQLAEAVRFEEQWERDASLRLRAHASSVIAEYGDHGRIRGGPPEEAIEDARRLYVSHYLEGTDVELVVWQREVGREIGRRVRDDLMHLGLVERGREVPLAEGARASRGDVILARKPDYELGIANGDALRVEAVNDDGSLTVRASLGRGDDGRRAWADGTLRYRGYGTADLAYSGTAHTVQGRTVTVGITVATGGESAQWLYSAMTRGARENIAVAFTQPAQVADPQPGTRPASELARHELVEAERDARRAPDPEKGHPEGMPPDPREPAAVLADIIERDATEFSALELQRRNLINADHLAALNAQWQGETAGLAATRYRQVIRDALPPESADELTSRQATWLWRTLRAAEAAGLDVREVVARAVDGRPLTGARDIASVIDSRIRRENTMVPGAWRPWSQQVPQVEDPEKQRYLTDLAAAMDARKERLGEDAAEHGRPWAVSGLGPVPAEPLERLEWERRASHLGAYRELYGWDHETEPVGPEPAGDSPEKRAAWHAAYGAITRTDAVDLSDRPDGSLLAMRDAYAAETEWAPPHTADELRAVRGALIDQRAVAVRADAEAQLARWLGEHERAGRHEALAASARAAESFYASIEDMDSQLMADREEWARVTEGSRHLAVMADAELRRRYPDAQLGPLRSAEPEGPSGELPEVTADTAAVAEQVQAMTERVAAFRERFRERLEERLNVQVPAEDPDYAPEGEAWPSAWPRHDRDAILQPPPPELRPSQAVADLVAEREAEA